MRVPWYRGPNSGWWGLLALAVLAFLGYLTYEAFGEPAKIRDAKHAIEITVQACEDGYAPEYYRRLSEAHTAIREVDDPEEEEMLETGLDNQEIAVGCHPPQ